MKNLWRVLTILLIVTAVNCDGDSKGLFSRWVAEDDGEVIDLTGGEIGVTQDLFIAQDDGTICEVDLLIGGDGQSGDFLMSNDTCGIYNGSFSYNLTNNVLTLCLSGDCFTYL